MDTTVPTTTVPTTAAPAIVVPRAFWLLAVAALFAAYLMLQDSGLVLLSQMGEIAHELFHDGRHALGFPCH